jgi:hypothetical protein
MGEGAAAQILGREAMLMMTSETPNVQQELTFDTAGRDVAEITRGWAAAHSMMPKLLILR